MKKPSVTTVLQRARQDLGKIPPHILGMATDRGSRVHDVIPRLIYPNEPFVLVEPDIAGYIQSWTDWYRSAVWRTLFVEKEIECDRYGYIGHIDWVGILRGDSVITVLDWKTPVQDHIVFACQTAAYWHLVERHCVLPEGWPVGRCGTLHLDKDGGLAKMEEYTEWSKYYFNGFLLALGYHNFFEGGI